MGLDEPLCQEIPLSQCSRWIFSWKLGDIVKPDVRWGDCDMRRPALSLGLAALSLSSLGSLHAADAPAATTAPAAVTAPAPASQAAPAPAVVTHSHGAKRSTKKK